MYLNDGKALFDSMHEECGVLGIYSQEKSDVGKRAYYGLYALQHRGQESAGIAVSYPKKFFTLKGMGLVSEVFEDRKALEHTTDSNVAIGHVRYSTTHGIELKDCQPFTLTGRHGMTAVAHNGNILNARELRKELIKDGVIFQSLKDIEVIAALINKYSENGIAEGVQKACERLSGAFCLVIATENGLIAVRDSSCIRPLCMGKTNDGLTVIASESCALPAVRAKFIRDITPGEIFIIGKDGEKSIFLTKKREALCIFEYVYFARPDSEIDGCSVYKSRRLAGELLAKNYPVEADIVSGVPDSAIVAAEGYSAVSGIPFTEVLAKNRYVGRTFIQPNQLMREKRVGIKLTPLRYNVEGKRIILLDDSIVRGTTSKKIVEDLREAGAKEIHMRICSPIIKYPCYFGIDTQKKDQLIGAEKSKEEIRKTIGCDSLEFLSIGDLAASAKDCKRGFCAACFNGDYPIEITEEEKIYQDKEKVLYGYIL